MSLSAQIGAPQFYNYYQQINKAEIKVFEHDTCSAIRIYKNVFKQYKGFESDYYTPIRLTLTQRNYKLLYWFIEQKVLKTGWFSPEELFDKKLFNEFLQSSYGKKYQRNFLNWIKENESFYDINSLRFLVSLDATDQLLRDDSLRPIRNFINSDSLYKESRFALINHIDSFNFIRFKSFCLSYGFPGQSKLGGKDLYLSALIIHFFNYVDTSLKNVSLFRNEQFLFLDSTLKQQIVLGEYHPFSYVYCIDSSLSSDGISFFGYPLFFRNRNGREFFNYPLIDPLNVDKRRAEIGLMLLSTEPEVRNLPLPPNFIK
jgi:hypothetical protein